MQQKRIEDRNVSYYAVPVGGALDEDDAPRAAAALAAVTDPVPVGAVERPLARAGRVFWRAAVLVFLVALTYGSTLFAPALLDGELDAFHRQPWPDLQWADLYRLPLSLVSQQPIGAPPASAAPPTTQPIPAPAVAAPTLAPMGAPPFLRVLMHQQAFVEVLHFLHLRVQSGDSPLTHRVEGLVLHATITVLAWLVLRRLNRPGGWLAAALFAVNPGSAAAVEWLDSRGRLWGALLAMLACWTLLRAAGVPVVQNIDAADVDEDEAPRGFRKVLSYTVAPRRALVGTVALLLAALCQPGVAWMGLVVVVLVKWRRGLRVWDIAWIIPVVVIVAAATVAAVRQPPPARWDPVVASLPTYQQALWWTGDAVRRVAWPLASADLSATGARPQVLLTCGVGGAFGLAVVALVLVRRWIGKGPAVAGLCTLLLLPTLVVPLALRPLPGLVAAQQMAAASTYLVCIPALAALADAVVAVAQRVKADIARRLTELVAAAGAILVLGCVAAVRANAFGDTETILKTAVRVNGRSWADRSRLAEWYIAQNRPDPALEVMEGLTIENCPDAATADAMGDLVGADHDLSGAMTWYRHAEALAPDDPEPIGRESQTLVDMDRVGDAVDNYERAIKQHPGSATLHFHFGLLLRQPLNNLPLAEDQFRRAIALDPEVADVHVALATVLADAAPTDDMVLLDKQLNAAALELQEAVRLDPENFDAYHDAGLILLRVGATNKAIAMLLQAVRLRPEWPPARNDLAVALIKFHRYKSAKFELTEALRLQPSFTPAQRNMLYLDRVMAAEQRRASVEGK